MMHASAYGRLGQDPTERESQAGKKWVTVSLAVDIAMDADQPPFWLRVVAFGKVAEMLLRHGKGDLLSVSGRAQINRWTDRQSGQAREQIQIVADSLVSARTVRPSGGKRKLNSRTPETTSETLL
jgi:single-strand DNA-binding protein